MIKKLNKRFISFILAFTMIFTNFFSIANINTVYGQDAKTGEAAEVQYTVNDAIEALKNQLSSKEQLKGWEAVGAKRSGLDISKIKVDKETENYKSNKTKIENKAEQSIILMELGEKPEELIKEIYASVEENIKNDKMRLYEALGSLALDKYNEVYKDGKIEYSDKKAIDLLVKKCGKNGSIFSSVFNTAPSMELLFKHKERPEVEEKINKAAEFMQSKLEENGTMARFSFDINKQINIVESLAKAGQNLTDKAWTSNGNTLIDGLFKGWNGKEYVEGDPTSETVGKVLNTLVTLKEEGYGDYVLKGVKFDGYNKVEDGKDSNKEDNKEKGYTVDDAVKVLVNYYEKDYYYSKGKTLDGLKAAAMKKAGADLTKWTIDKETDSFKKSWCPLAAKAETSMILMDFKENPAEYKKRNLIKEIADDLNKISNAKGLGRNEVKGLIAIDRYNETFKENKVQCKIEELIKHLLSNQKEDGSFYQTPQTTAKAMWALSKHKDIEGVTEAIKKAENYVKNNQKDDGGIYTKKFFTYIQADAVNYLIGQGEDLTSKEWLKDGKTPIEGIFVLWNGKNFTKDTTPKDEYSIDKVLYALASLKEKGYGNYVLKGVKFDGYKKTEEPQENPDQKVNENTVDGLINKVVDYYNKEYFYEKNGLLDSWQYGTLVRAKADLSKKNWTLQEEYITNQDRNLNLIGTKIDQSLMLLDRGKNPNNFKGRKLINEIKEYLDAYKERFTFIDIEGVIAIDRYNKKFPDSKVNYNVNHAIEKILESQEQNGGFKEREEGICARNTGVALIALNNHRNVTGVSDSIKKAIKYLHDIQKPDGGLYNETFITGYHGEALQGLIEVGENPTSKEWTTEKGRNPIDALFKLYKSNDSFDNMAYESKHNRGWWEGTWKALYTLLDAKEAGYGKYEPKGIGEYKVDVDEVQKKCKVNIAIVQPKKDGFDCLIGPKQVEINNKEHKAGITALGALQATTKLYTEIGGMVSEIYGNENKGNGGWTYLVNDVMPDILSNQYEVKDGDNIVWYYSINGMNDNAPRWEQLTQKGKDYSTIINDNLIKSAKFIAGKDKLDYFDVVALRGISKKQYENQFKKYVQDIEKAIKNKDESLFNKNGQIKDIDCAKAIIGLTAAGQDAINVAGVNLIEELCKTDLIEEALKKDSNDNINLEPIAYALLALDSGKYKTSKDSKVTRDKLVKVLLDNSRKDKKYKPYMGGWNDNEKAGEPDKPLTGIILAALAPYKDSNKDVKAEIDRVVDVFAETQGDDGGFGKSMGWGKYKKHSEMSSKVIIGLCLNGVDPISTKFTKGNMLECVLNHATKDGFSKKVGEETNEVSTSYAIQALTSYKNFKDKKEGTYTFEDFSGKIVEKPEQPEKPENPQKPEEQKDYSKEVKEAIESCVNYILKIEELSNWHAAALKAASTEIPERYIKSKKRAIVTKDPKFIKNGEIADNDCATTIIGVTAAGKDARNISGFNLIEHLCKEGKIDHNKIHRSIYALIALDCGNYEIPKNSKLKRQELINDMTWTWDDEEGWSPWGGGIDPDTTGMALTALAPYKDQEEAKEVIDKAVKKLSEAQNKNGGYNFKYENEVNESSESIAQVIIGLCANGIDPTSKEFTKNGNNLIDALLKFKTKDGFKHTKDGRTNEMATYQVLQALGAYKSFKEDKKGIYDFEDFSAKVLKEDGKIEIENLTQKKQFKLGEDAKVRIKAENLESEEKNVTLIVALYNENGEFVNYSSSKQTLKSGQEVELESMIKLPKEGKYQLKAFVWDDFEKMTPLSDEINMVIVK